MALSHSKKIKYQADQLDPVPKKKTKTENKVTDKSLSSVKPVKKKSASMGKKKMSGKGFIAKKGGMNKASDTPHGKTKSPVKIDINKTAKEVNDSQKQLGAVKVQLGKNEVISIDKETNKANTLNSEKLKQPDNKVKKTGKTKKSLTYRQIHKRKKLIEKRKAIRNMNKTSKAQGKQVKTHSSAKKGSDKKKVQNEDSTTEEHSEKIILPKTVAEATSNWRKLQMTMKSEKGSLKRKKDPLKVRNPKYRKLDEKSINERVIHEVTKKEDKSPEIWFDDVDEIFIDDRQKESKEKVTLEEGNDETTPGTKDNELVKPEAFKGVTSIVGIDCEMVGVKNNESTLARVSIVNRYGEPVYDKFVKPKEKVTDYRTHVSGIRPEDLKNGEPFKKVRKEVADILKGRILIGHALTNDFKALKLRHPATDVRDTSAYPPFRALFNGKTPGLRKLTAKVLSVKIQGGEHNSIQDAQAAVRLYTMHRTQWESECKFKGKNKKKTKGLKTLNEKEPVDKFEVVDRLWNV